MLGLHLIISFYFFKDICDNVTEIYRLSDHLHDNERDIIIKFLTKVESEEAELRENVERIRKEAEVINQLIK